MADLEDKVLISTIDESVGGPSTFGPMTGVIASYCNFCRPSDPTYPKNSKILSNKSVCVEC